MILQLSFRNWLTRGIFFLQRSKIGQASWIKTVLLPACLTLILVLLIFNQSTAWFVGRPHSVKLPESLFFSVYIPKPISFQGSSDTPVGRPLTDSEREIISRLLPNAPLKTIFPKFEQLPLFILHDTAGLLAKETIYHQQRQNQGPSGDGIAAYIARDGEPIVTRIDFWDIRRPTALAYEKALDILPERVRNQYVRQVYQLTSASAKQAAFEQVVMGLKVNHNNLIKGAKIWLNTRSESEFDSIRRHHPHRLDGAKSTGIWAMTQVCHDVLDGVNMANSPDKQAKLVKVCQKVYPALKTSRQRIAASVNVEIVQHTGSHCFLNEAQVKAYNASVGKSAKIEGNKVISLQKEGEALYPDLQYEGLALVYLYCALQAGLFPEITTHFLLDKGIGSHCDPRGLDLNYLYEKISGKLGHPWGTRYGIVPQYGTNLQAGDNVWWAEEVLGMKP